MRRYTWLCMILVLLPVLHGQQTPQYKPTEIQLLRLQVRQRDAWLAQRNFMDAQRVYQQSLTDLNTEAEAVRKENKWPDSVIFDADKIEFSEPPKNTARPASPTSGGKP